MDLRGLTWSKQENELVGLLVKQVQDDVIYITDVQGIVRSWNAAAEGLFGYSRDEILESSANILFTPEDVSKDVPKREMILATETGLVDDDRWYVRKDGTRFWSSGTVTPLWDDANALRGYARILHDRTTRRRSEEAVATRPATILATALDAIVSIDREGRIVEFNPAAEQLFGYEKSAVLGQPVGNLIVPPRFRERHFQGMAHLLATGEGPVLGKRLEMPALHADGTELMVEIAVTQVPAEGTFTAYMRDITNNVQSERHRNARLAVAQAMATAVSLSDATSGILQAVCGSLGWDLGCFWRREFDRELMTCVDSWHQPSAALRKFAEVSRRHTFVCGMGLPGRIWQSAKPAWIKDVVHDTNFQRVPYAAEANLHGAFGCPIIVDGAVFGAVEFFSGEIREPNVDLLEMMNTICAQVGQFWVRKEAERRLRQSEALFAGFMKHLPGLAWIKDLEGRYCFANDAAERAFRTPRSTLYGKIDSEIFDDATAASFRENDRRAIDSGTGVQLIETLEDEQGVVRHSLVSKFPILGPDGKVALVGGMAIDITEQRLMEEALQHSEKRFRALMAQAPFSIQVFSPDGRTISVNRAWEKLWGVRFEQVATYNVLEDQQLASRGVLEYIRRGFAGEAVRIPAIQYNPNETIPNSTQESDPRRWLSAVIYPLKDSRGEVREVVLIHEDITARHLAEEALRESERLYRAIGESIDYGVWVCDPQGQNVYASESFLRLVGLTQEQCSAFGWGDVLHPDEVAPTVAAWQECVRAGGQWDREHQFRGVDGEWHSILARGVPVKNDQGEITAWAGINLDIRRLKQVEDRLREADRRKDEFLATLAHELRNPLAPILNSLQILKLARVDEAVAQQTREVMERQVHHLARLVDDLLDVSRVMRGKIDLRKEYVELATVVARAVEIAQPLIEVNNHRLELSLPTESLMLDADPVRLAQVVGNLLTNAAKYTETSGDLRLTVRRDGTSAVLSVEDNGIGIAPDVLPHVFELFVQADHGSAKSHGGLGIGLTLVKNLVELHGGNAYAHSEGLGHGSKFVVVLPLCTTKPAPRPISTPAAPISGHRLLVVDDNRDAADMLGLLLQVQGHDVHVAYDGASALEMAVAFRPVMVFLDIGMPDMDGYEVARRLRQQPETQQIAIVALTGWGQLEDRRRTKEAGCDHHLVKPPEMSVLLSLLAELD